MNVDECDVPSGSMLSRELIERAYFHDSYRVPLSRRELNIVDIFFGIFAHHPLWMKLLLHELGAFHWHYWWWNAATFPVIVVFGYLTSYVMTFIVYDAPSRAPQLTIVGSLAAVNLVLGLTFGPILGWI